MEVFHDKENAENGTNHALRKSSAKLFGPKTISHARSPRARKSGTPRRPTALQPCIPSPPQASAGHLSKKLDERLVSPCAKTEPEAQALVGSLTFEPTPDISVSGGDQAAPCMMMITQQSRQSDTDTRISTLNSLPTAELTTHAHRGSTDAQVCWWPATAVSRLDSGTSNFNACAGCAGAAPFSGKRERQRRCDSKSGNSAPPLLPPCPLPAPLSSFATALHCYAGVTVAPPSLRGWVRRGAVAARHPAACTEGRARRQDLARATE